MKNIYVIYCKGEICYVGKTVDMKRRWVGYKTCHSNPNHKDYGYKIHQYMREHGFNNFQMELLESVPDEYGVRAEQMWYWTFKELGFDMKNTQVPGNGRGKGSEYYVNNQMRKVEKIQCELCGKIVCRSNIRRHQRRSDCLPKS